MASGPRYWILLTAPHITETYIPPEGDYWEYLASPTNLVKRDDILYFWLTYKKSLYGWGEVVETPEMMAEVSYDSNGEPKTTKRQRIKVRRCKQFYPPITEVMMR